jgi:hypothetical protein
VPGIALDRKEKSAYNIGEGFSQLLKGSGTYGRNSKKGYGKQAKILSKKMKKSY